MTHLSELVSKQRAFSKATFGPGSRLEGVISHIERELKEIRKTPQDPAEWADLILLALDGAWRQGVGAHALADAVEFKIHENESRRWPDWRNFKASEAVEHIPAGYPDTAMTPGSIVVRITGRSGAHVAAHLITTLYRVGKIPPDSAPGRFDACVPCVTTTGDWDVIPRDELTPATPEQVNYWRSVVRPDIDSDTGSPYAQAEDIKDADV